MTDWAHDWIEWKGGEPPVEANTKIVVRLRRGVEEYGSAFSLEIFGHLNWEHDGGTNDIVRYRVVKP